MHDLVSDWMTHKVIAVSASTSIEEAASLMQQRRIRRLAVIDADVLVGILSLGDVRAAMASASADTAEFAHAPRVGSIMTPDPITIPLTASVALAAQTMLQVKVSGLPVVDVDGRLCGLLSESDLFRYIVEISKPTT
ncbi:MAG: CBS domain-containing protein [Gammaproteobacteria bacterium]|nr:CBS domain-containing protein [Gammaproteobacteria bacterium]